MRVGIDPWVGLKEWFRWSLYPSYVQRSPAVSSFCSWHLRSDSWSLLYLVVIIWSFCILLVIICPSCACTQLFLVPYSFFVFCAGGSICPGVSTEAKDLRFQVPGPRFQPVLHLKIRDRAERELFFMEQAWNKWLVPDKGRG